MIRIYSIILLIINKSVLFLGIYKHRSLNRILILKNQLNQRVVYKYMIFYINLTNRYLIVILMKNKKIKNLKNQLMKIMKFLIKKLIENKRRNMKLSLINQLNI